MLADGIKRTCNPNAVLQTIRKSKRRIPCLYAWLADLPRLCPGAGCWALVLAAAARSGPGGWTPELEKEWLLAVCRGERRSLDRDINYLESSGMTEVKHSCGAVSIRLCFKRWPKLPDYAPAPRVVQISRLA
jgi:hypothetical protein